VVLIHGLWMPGAAMLPLARRLKRGGWETAIFSYTARRATVRQNAAALAAFVSKLEGSAVHFAAHSFGGLVLAQYLQDFPARWPGRAVLLGTPYRGSHVAGRMSHHRLGRWLCGLSLHGALLGDGPRWPRGRELGVIAGTAPFGVGRLIPGLPRPNDGLVAVAETPVPGQTDFVTLPLTHSGLLFSAAAARQVAAFLAAGRFSR
jgi:pimeloyl-ACP methyl ester carboxylesterase